MYTITELIYNGLPLSDEDTIVSVLKPNGMVIIYHIEIYICLLFFNCPIFILSDSLFQKDQTV